MKCAVCGKEASAICIVCGYAVCKDHTIRADMPREASWLVVGEKKHWIPRVLCPECAKALDIKQ